MKIKLKSLLTALFTRNDEQYKLDQYVTSMQPTTVAEVDYWINQFERKSQAHGSFMYPGR